MSTKTDWNTLVMKFGGTSVGSIEGMECVVQIVSQANKEWQQVVVVTSAFSKVTDALLDSARQAARGNQAPYLDTLEMLKKRHLQALQYFSPVDEKLVASEIDGLILYYIHLIQAIVVLGETTPRALDAVAGLGERLAVLVLAAILRSRGIPAQAVDATELIVSDDQHQAAFPLMPATQEKTGKVLQPLFEKGIVPVVTGFIAATVDGVLTTLGRGGSDYSAAILGVVLDADEVWIWTDVDGVLSADPRVVPDARPILEISFAEVGELAYFGAKVLHPKTIRPVVSRNMPLWVKNTFNPDFPGTRITQNPSKSRGEITAISMIKDLSILTVEGRGMLGVPGIAARTFGAVARTGASVLMISQSSSEQSICFTIPSIHNGEVLKSIESEMALELLRGDIDRVWARDQVVIVSIIGSGMRETPGVSARIFGALGKNLINVIAIAQGSSEYSISLVLDQKDAVRAVQAIHAETAPQPNGGDHGL